MKKNVLDQLKLDDPKIAIIGATNDSKKYGNKIYKDLKNKGYSVYGINNKATTIDGDKAYHTIKDLGFSPDIINVVVHPKIGLEIIKSACEMNLDNFWLQPGAESDEIIEYLEKMDKSFLSHSCVMVQTRNKS
ncbi:MAG: CoA-binding protein [Leptospiraceae bacterium]|nr:CoA-binding protein [Leptospiraceae bacterium]MCP5495343.1 CoA-binding protein [Leptospiraceae bacterium]